MTRRRQVWRLVYVLIAAAVCPLLEPVVQAGPHKLVICFFRLTAWRPPADLYKPIMLFRLEDLPEKLWEACVVYPLVEEIVYRSVGVPALMVAHEVLALGLKALEGRWAQG